MAEAVTVFSGQSIEDGAKKAVTRALEIQGGVWLVFNERALWVTSQSAWPEIVVEYHRMCSTTPLIGSLQSEIERLRKCVEELEDIEMVPADHYEAVCNRLEAERDAALAGQPTANHAVVVAALELTEAWQTISTVLQADPFIEALAAALEGLSK